MIDALALIACEYIGVNQDAPSNENLTKGIVEVLKGPEESTALVNVVSDRVKNTTSAMEMFEFFDSETHSKLSKVYMIIFIYAVAFESERPNS